MLTMVLILILVIALQFFLKYFLGKFGVPYLLIELIIDLVLSFIYAVLNYPGNKKEAYKDARFHQTVLVYFLVLFLITLVFYFWF
jgi:hypothetical protein